MANTEELEAQILAEMESNPEAYADTGTEYCTVDDDTRLVTIPEKYKKLGTESDEKAKRVWFRFPKIVGNNGIDLSAISVRVNFRNANGDGDIYIVEDLTTDGDFVIFSWELTRKVTAYKGNVSFVVCAVKSATDGTIKNEWNTTLNKECEVLEGLEVTEQITQENPDIIEYILANLGGSVSAEQIATAVEEYMSAHPFTETDPTVPDWAKQPEKPSYTADEVGALPNTTTTLPNPNALTFTGAVTGSYDGSSPIEINIPEGGGTGVTVDTTLSVAGQAADAKATGDAISSLSEEIANVSNPTDEQVSIAVNTWLDEHPEATTTVQPGSIDEEKLHPDLLKSLKNAGANAGYKWIACGYMREHVRDFQGWAHCMQYDKELGKAVGIVISGTGSHSNSVPLYRVTIENNGYMSEYEEMVFNYPETDTAETGYIGSFIILNDGTYWCCDSRQRIFTSPDKGYTWDFVTQITLNGRSTYNNDSLFGVTVLDNGRFVGGNIGNVASETYYSDNGIDWTTVVMDVSQLGQQTYPEGGFVPFEPFFIDCGNGKVIQYARASMNAYKTYAEGAWTKQEGAVYSVSDDYGTTWTPWQWSKSIVDMTANNGKVVVIGDVVHCVYGSRYLGYTDEYGNTPFFALRYTHTTLEKVLTDTWEESVVVDVGHWDETTAERKADCGYPSIWKDENNNLFVVYYDSDES